MERTEDHKGTWSRHDRMSRAVGRLAYLCSERTGSPSRYPGARSSRYGARTFRSVSYRPRPELVDLAIAAQPGRSLAVRRSWPVACRGDSCDRAFVLPAPLLVGNG